MSKRMGTSRRGWIRTPQYAAIFLCGSLVLCGGLGCSFFQGRDADSAGRKKGAAEEDERPPFEPSRMAVLPAAIPREFAGAAASMEKSASPGLLDDDGGEGNDLAASTSGLLHVVVKPGHCVVTRHELRANRESVVATLENSCLDRNSALVTLPNLPVTLAVEQRISLPQGQTRQVDMPLFLPLSEGGRRFLQVLSRLKDRSGGRILSTDGHGLSVLRPDQYHLLVLSSVPQKYAFLRILPCITPPRSIDSSTQLPWDFLVHRPNIDERITIPESMLMLTSTAYLVWDDLDPAKLTAGQALALIDWIHWGGQLVVNGPGALDSLKGSFLDPYLPAVEYRPKPLAVSVLERLDATWSQLSQDAKKNKTACSLSLTTKDPPQILDLQLREGAILVPNTEGLLAERAIGRGRIAVTAFDMAAAPFIHWPGYDGFVNSCLLRRPPRRFDPGVEREVIVSYRASSARYGGAEINTRLRLFSRDASDGRPSVDRPEMDESKAYMAGFSVHPEGGLGAWSDFSLPPLLAQEALTKAAGLKIPRANLIANMIGVYLIVLVPGNWLLFRSLGRVEWAWLAAPVIAIVGAMTVTKLAQLDVGFVRSQTDLAIVELQPNYSRAHVSRFTSLYSSLTTNYRLKGGSTQLVMAPMADSLLRGNRRIESIATFRQRLESSLEVSRFRVLSNSTATLRSEELLELGGGVPLLTSSANEVTLRNETKITFRAATVMVRDAGGFGIGEINREIAPNEVFQVQLTRNQTNWKRDLRYAAVHSSRGEGMAGQIDLTELRDLAIDPIRAEVGECRFAAWTDEIPSSLEIVPHPAQSKSATLVVANLRYAPVQNPVPDLSSPPEVFEELLHLNEQDEEAALLSDESKSSPFASEQTE